VMNLIGPLANPARAGRQVIGVADPARLELIALALQALGTTHSLIVHGEPGLDEFSPLGPTEVIELRGAALTRWTFDLATHGLRPARREDLAAGAPAENAAIVEQVLGGGGSEGATTAVLLNAAAAIYVSGREADFGSALGAARGALANGKGSDALRRLRAAAPRTSTA